MARASMLAPLRYLVNRTWTSVGNLVLIRPCPALCNVGSPGKLRVVRVVSPECPSRCSRATWRVFWFVIRHELVARGSARGGFGSLCGFRAEYFSGRPGLAIAHISARCYDWQLLSALAGAGAIGRTPGACPTSTSKWFDLPSEFILFLMSTFRLSFYVASYCAASMFLLCAALCCILIYPPCIIF
jgi:hypothetical protein